MQDTANGIGKTPGEVAKLFGCSPATIARYCRSGELRFVSIGPRLRRIPDEAVQEFLARRNGSSR